MIYIGSILFPLIIPLYAVYFGLNWSTLQVLIAYGLTFDIISGCLVYNSHQHKELTYKEKLLSGNVKHALLHMQPLVVGSFFTEVFLLYIGLYWFILYLIFIALFEPVPRVNKKMGNWITGIFITINFVFLGIFFLLIQDVALLLYGSLTYLILAPLTAVQLCLPEKKQRLFGITIVIFVCLLNVMFLKAPDGFQWFIPVLFVKLFVGYNPREI